MTGAYTALQVSLGARSYPILIDAGIIEHCGDLIAELMTRRTVGVVTNENVAAIYYDKVHASLVSAGFTVHKIIVPDGEEYKNSRTLATVYDEAFAAGLDRGALLLALGGGVIGDLTGYAAATLLRGIPFVQIPTTLLAQVDSSVGGKTGINHPRGKNLIGAFHQPLAVLADVSTLLTLSARDFSSGLAEVVKYGMSLDSNFFTFLETNALQILSRDIEMLKHIVAESCRLKAQIVAMDEREGGLRAVLNFGHTFGHAVEALTQYQKYSHGEAVAIGMAQAARLAVIRGLAVQHDVDRLLKLLGIFGLPIHLPEFSALAYEDAIRMDKKVREGALTFVLNKGIGAYAFSQETSVADLVDLLINYKD